MWRVALMSLFFIVAAVFIGDAEVRTPTYPTHTVQILRAEDKTSYKKYVRIQIVGQKRTKYIARVELIIKTPKKTYYMYNAVVSLTEKHLREIERNRLPIPIHKICIEREFY